MWHFQYKPISVSKKKILSGDFKPFLRVSKMPALEHSHSLYIKGYSSLRPTKETTDACQETLARSQLQ